MLQYINAGTLRVCVFLTGVLFTSSAWAQRQPVPSEAELATASALVTSVYGKEAAVAKTAISQETLAKRMLDDALATRDDARAQYVLAQRARQLAIKAGNYEIALAAVALHTEKFETDALALQLAALDELSTTVKDPARAYDLLSVTHDALETALQAQKIESATQLSELLPKIGARISDPVLRKQIDGRVSEVRSILAQWPKYQAAEETLRTDPVDAEANHETGLFWLLLGKWDTALPYLALSSEKPLATVAEQELKGVSTVEDAMKLAEGWWLYAQTCEGWLKAQCQVRALNHFKARWSALSPLSKTKFANYIETFQEEQALSIARWEAYHWDHAKPYPWHIRLSGPRGQGIFPAIVTFIEYRGALDITCVARTEDTNIRIEAYGKAEVIWNWELNRNELRMHRPNGSKVGHKTKALDKGRFYTLRWVYAPDAMRVLVNGNVVFSEKWKAEPPPNQVRVYTMESTIDVRSLTIKPLAK